MTWLPLMLIEFVIAFIDPYIGFYSLFTGIMIFIFAMCEVNLRARIRVNTIRMGSDADEDTYRKLGNMSLRTMVYTYRFVAVFAVVFLASYAFLTYILLTGDPAKAYTFAIIPVAWSPAAGIAAVVIVMVLQIVASTSVFLNGNHVERLRAAYAQKGAEMKEESKGVDLSKMRFGVSALSYELIALATVLAVISPLRWFGLVSLCLLWAIFIIKLVLGGTKRTRRLAESERLGKTASAVTRAAADKQMAEFLPSGYATRLTMATIWITGSVIVGTFIMVGALGEASAMKSVFFWLSILATAAATISLVRDVKAIASSGMIDNHRID